jgi:hypothetical protein
MGETAEMDKIQGRTREKDALKGAQISVERAGRENGLGDLIPCVWGGANPRRGEKTRGGEASGGRRYGVYTEGAEEEEIRGVGCVTSPTAGTPFTLAVFPVLLLTFFRPCLLLDI